MGPTLPRLTIIIQWVVDSEFLASPVASTAAPKQAEECADKRSSQEKGYRDLAQSVRSANAAEEAAWLSYLQARISLVGAVLLVLTLGATAWAAWGAADAAIIADETRRQTSDLEAPFVYPVIVTNGVPDALRSLQLYDHPRSIEKPRNPSVSCSWANHGRTPATLQYVQIELAHYTNMPDELPTGGQVDFAVPPIVGAGEESKILTPAGMLIPLDREASRSIFARESIIFLFGRVWFGSVAGVSYTQTFCMAYNPEVKIFTPWHPKLNQRTRNDKK